MSEKINISELPPVYYDNVNPKHEVDIIDYGVLKSNVPDTINYYSTTDSIVRMDKLFTDGTLLENVELITKPIPIYDLKCKGRYRDAPQVFKTEYEKYEPKIRDAYINNRYCYISYLKWFFNLKDHPLYNSNDQYEKQIVCVGHSNKMKELFDTVFKKTAAIPESNINNQPVALSFIRHGLSCNNIANALAVSKTSIVEPQKDWEPSLTVYGMLSAIKKGKNIGKKFSNNVENINVCVSPLLRTWQTAILLFCNNYKTITLHICPYLTEAYPGPVSQYLEIDRGNTPIEFKWQLYKLLYFLRLFKDNSKRFIGDNNIVLTNIHLKFIDMDGTVYRGLNYSIPMADVENMSIYKNDTDNNKILIIPPSISTENKPQLSCRDKITRLEKTIPILQNQLDELKPTCETKISGGNPLNDIEYTETMKEKFENNKKIVKKAFEKYEEHNMWEIELVIQTENIVKMKITEGIDKPKMQGDSLNIIKECEETCVLGSISRDILKKNETCGLKHIQVNEAKAAAAEKLDNLLKSANKENIKSVTQAKLQDDVDIIDRTFIINDKGKFEVVKPPSKWNPLNWLTRKNKVVPSKGGKKNHRKTAKKSSRKTRRKSRR